MNNRKSTKRALLTSILSLLLCCSMLIGTTFAWFTDEVKSANNIITAGNLDVELYYMNDETSDWTEVTAYSNIFKQNTLWEPGHTEVVKLKVVNAGTLALKYQLGVNVASEVGSINVNGKSFKLSEYIKFGIVEGDKTYTRDEAVAAVDETANALNTAYNSGVVTLDPKNDASDKDEKIVTMVVYMPTSVGNEANYRKGEAVPTINLGINLFATQLNYENDSFGPDYDAGAWTENMTVATEAELITALNAAVGENILITLADDIVLTGTWTPIGDKDAGEYFTGTLDGNGHTISGLNVTANDYDGFISAAKDATIKNLTVEGTVNGVNAAGIVARVEGNTVIENCVSNVAVIGTTKAGGIVSNVTGANAKIINCTNNAPVSCSNAKAGGVGGIIGYVNTNAYVEVINCTNNGAVTGTDNQTTGAVVGYAAANSSGLIAGFVNTGAITGKNYVGDGNGRWIEDENGLVLAGYCGTPANWIAAKAINNAADLLALGGKSVEGAYMLTADIDLAGAAMPTIGAAYGKSLTIIGGGHTIANATTAHTNHNGMKHHGFFYAYTNSTMTISDLIFENIVIDATKDTERNYGAAIVVAFADGGSTVNLNNVDVNNSKVLNNTPDLGDEAGVYVGYQTGTLTMVDCDSTGCSVAGETTAKTGAFIGMVNGTATLINCTTDLTIGACNRIAGTLTINGGYIPVSVDSAEEIKTALTNGGDVILSGDIILSDTVSIEKDTDIDLNGNNLTVSRLEAKGDVTISGGTVIHAESNYPALSVTDGGTLTMNEVAVISENYCNLMTSGSLQAAEFVGIQVFGGTCVLNDCDITVEIKDLRYANSAVGIGIHGGSLIMNGGSITVTSVGSTNASYDSQVAIFAGSDTEKSVTLINVTVVAKEFLCASKGNIIVNTTDAQNTWDGKCSATGGTYTINYNYEA